MTGAKAAAVLAGLVATLSPAMAQDAAFEPSTVLDAATGDWNRDGHDDLVVLAFSGPEEDMDIGVYVYLRDADRNLLDLALTAPDAVWGGRDFYGQEPSVTALANGSFVVGTQNFGVGRNKWEHKLSVAYRNERFVVAGLTYNSFDTLQEDPSIECDLNLLTGKGKVNGKQVTFRKLNLTLAEWKGNDDGVDPGVAICEK